MKYTYSDDEDEAYSDATTSRRSTRNTGTHTPAEGLGGPTVTLSGRQVKSRKGGAYGESMLSGTQTPAIAVGGFDGACEEPEHDESSGARSRPRRAAAGNRGLSGWASKGRHIEGYNSVDEMDDDDEDDASEHDYGDDEDEDGDDNVPLESDVDDQDDLTDVDDDLEDTAEDEKKTLIIKLPVKTPSPERKFGIKVSLTPERQLPELASERPVGSIGHPTQPKNTVSNGTEPSSLSGTYQGNKEGPQSSAAVPSSNLELASLPSVAPTKSTVIPPKSPSRQAPPSALSPSLTYRGSPGKPPAFSPSINVGCSGT